jgi:hypothetical protein
LRCFWDVLRVFGCFDGFYEFRTGRFWGFEWWEIWVFYHESLLGVRMLSEFVDIELIDSIVAAILFWDGLTVFLEQFDFVKVGVLVILFFRIEVNNLAVLNPIDCVYELNLFISI